MFQKLLKLGIATGGAIALAGVASATVIRVSEADFEASAGLITFSEFDVNTANPIYTPSDYGGGVDSPTVTFEGFFLGQSLSTTPGIDCPGAAPTACVVGSATDPLTLDVDAPDTFITNDASNPSSPVLSGSPVFNGPMAILFSTDQFGVGFDAGFFNAAVSTAISAYSRDGTLLGSVSNAGTGIEFLGLASDSADIAGVALELIGSEPAGFAIDNLRFGVLGQVTPPTVPVPLPAAGWLLLGAIGGLGALGRRKARAA